MKREKFPEAKSFPGRPMNVRGRARLQLEQTRSRAAIAQVLRDRREDASTIDVLAVTG